MKDLSKQVENDVKDSIAQNCLKLGINKDEVYYCVGGHGVIGPQIITNPDTGEQAIIGWAPSWMLAIGLRIALLGKKPVTGSLPVFGVIPTREDIDKVIFRLLGEMDQKRTAIFKGEAQ